MTTPKTPSDPTRLSGETRQGCLVNTLLEHTHRTAAPPFRPIWTNRKAIVIGYLAGRGYTAAAIERELADGTTAPTIRVQLQRAGISRASGDIVPISLSRYEIGRLGRLAHTNGMEPAEWLRQIAAASIRDDLFKAIVDS